MPKLPSGRLVGFDATPLENLFEDIYACKDGAVLELMDILEREHLYSYLEVIYFVHADTDTPIILMPGSEKPPSDLQPKQSGLRVTEVLSAVSDWPPEDKETFISFLVGEAALNVLDELMTRVVNVKARIKTEGSPMQNFEANAHSLIANWNEN